MNKSLVTLMDKIAAHTLMDEQSCIDILPNLTLEAQLPTIKQKAIDYINYIRSIIPSPTESFIHEYSLSTEEGVAIMCIAEALLRIPDKSTAKALIDDKLHTKNWKQHLGQSNSLFVNASSWGLFLTGGIIDFGNSKLTLGKLIKKLGEPLILQVIKKAITYISNEFILGNNLTSALKNAKSLEQKGYSLSIDILGESSRTKQQADHYYSQYIEAITNLPSGTSHNLSIKLSALHPKANYKKYDILKQELLPKLTHLITLCQKSNISISFDAEESFRQDIYLKLLTDLITHDKFLMFNGIGLVIQGYQKRAFYIIDYIIELAKITKKRIPVRLVKGAYWDSEIKFSQEYGLSGYPVFTHKKNTDVSYIACAKKILAHNDLIYPQFATHNALTIATIQHLATNKDFEFQKLHGMGGAIYDKIISEGYNCRIYAPIGKYEDLLAYLMRRLLENGANTSFVNIVYDEKIPVDQVIQPQDSKYCLSLPENIWGESRKNSIGYDLGFKAHYDEIVNSLAKFKDTQYKAASIIDGKIVYHGKPKTIINPANHNQKIGEAYTATNKELTHALTSAHNAFDYWSTTPVTKRTQLIGTIGNLLHKNRHQLYSLLIHEAGKSIEDSISEVREAIDFARYYSHYAEELCNKPIQLPAITGENNKLYWYPRGVFACISPWNFPLSIFSGQILAALASGNTVLAKPAGNTPLIADYTIKLMHEAGIPKNVLQLLISNGKQISETILKDDRIKGVCFTGSLQTALSISRTIVSRETGIVPIIAETGGQNCMIVDASALLEQAADLIVLSAFSSVGQRCSALRVLYIQEEIFKPLMELVVGAMNELTIGNPENFINDLGPIINNEAKKELENHIKSISKQKGCSLFSVHNACNSNGLEFGNFFVPHIIKIQNINNLKQENFGPILHVISYKSKDLDKVIDEVNSSEFGLTFGIQSRIESKIEYIANKIKAGNIYANRTIIGAQVGTHPFGGENKSGTGFKAGGPHYLTRFMTERTLITNTTAIGGNLELLRGDQPFKT